MRILLLAGAVAVSACTGSTTTDAGTSGSGVGAATAELRSASGERMGTATATEVDGGVRVSVEGMALSAGPHGAHVHMVGRCDAPTFETALGHWNPTGRQHGTQNPAGPHAGDMPNLIVGSDGRGSLTMTLPGGTFAGLLDADGSAFIVHAGADDLRTDPSGNSGGRLACGVFSAS